MNRYLYRLVFNAARGQIMAVAEVAASHAGSSDAAGTTAGPQHHAAGAGWMAKARSFARSTIASVCALLMALPPGQMARAQVVADPQAAASLRPQILSTANGTTQVNIQAPSAAGVSRNVYSQFDVDNRGVILNNATAATQTQIGGWVQANGNLSGGSARVILNEVNATAPSQLRGFVEVAGQRAEVVIANPAGIAVNGGGFINASAVTLTTGTPILNSGNLEGYRVNGGQIQINGAGLDASGADYARILARAVQVNAGLWAQDLKVVTGAQLSNADSSVVSPLPPAAGTTPQYALDVAALGGMYAGKITLIGTEAGLGVNNAGVMAANGDLVLQSDGQLINRGVLDAQNTRIRSSELHNLGTGRIYGDHVALQTPVLNNTPETANGFTSAPVIAARERLDIGVGSLVNGLDALLLSGGDIAIGGTLDAQHGASGSAQSILNAGGTIEALGSLHASADSIRNTNPGFAYDIRSDGSVDGKEFITSSGIYTAEQVAWILAENTFGGAGPGGGYRYSSGQGRLLPIGHLYADKKYQPYYNGANAHTPPHYVSSTDSEGLTTQTYVGDSFGVGASDPIWGIFGLSTPTGGVPGPRPVGTTQCDDGNCYTTSPPAAETAAWEAAAAPWLTLQSRLDTFRASVNASAITFTAFRNFSQDIPVAVVTTSTPGQILSGGNMTLHAGTELLNEQSRIMAGGTLAITGQSLNNQGLDITAQALRSGRAYAWSNFNHGCGNVKGCDYNYDAYRDSNYSVYVPKALSLNSASSQSGITPGSAGLGAAGSLPPSSLFHTAPDPQAHYLIETDPLFTSYRTWLSSDYMLSALALDPALTQKRLGDGYYEQRLVREQVAQLTGRRFLDEYTSDEQQYQALMNAGVTYAQAHSLRPGIALSAEQMAALTQDLVWLVEQTVTLPDGTTVTALVPRLYTVARSDDLDGNGALLSARSLDIQLQGQFSSSGRIAALENARISANDIQLASSGATDLQADRITLQATQDIKLIGSRVEAGNSMNLQAGRDIQLTTTSSSGTSADGQHSLTQIDRVASLSVTGANGTLQATAGRDVQLTGAIVESAGAASLQAGNNLVLNAVRTESSNFYQHGDTVLRDRMSQDMGSRVNATGNVDLLAMNSITGTAASVASEGQTRMIAGDTISLVEGRDERSYDQQWKTASYDFFARTETSTKIQDQRSTALLGQVSGTEGVTMQAGSAIQLSGQQLAAELGEIQLGAPQIVLASALNLVNHSESTETKTIGISTGVLTGTFQPGQGMFYQVNLDQANSQTSLAATRLTAQDITLNTTDNGNTGGDITLAAVELRATGNQSQNRGGTSSEGRINLDAGDGSVNFATVQTTEVASISRKASDIAWQATSGSGRQDETAQHTKIDGELTLNAAQIKVQGTATSLEQAAKALAQQPGLEWLGQLQSDPALAAKVDWQKINEAHKDWQYNQQGLTPAGAAIITLVVAFFTAGAASGAASSLSTSAGLSGAAAASASAAMAAGMSMLMGQAAVTMINTGGNIGDTLKQMGSKDSVRALITAMVTAGALGALNYTPPDTSVTVDPSYSGVGGNVGSSAGQGTLQTFQKANDFSGNLLKNITNNLASATIDAAINGKPLDSETLADSLKSALITAGMAQGANSIGDAKVTGDLNAFTHKVAHAILGCAAGASMDGGSCATGAVGGVVGELAAEFYNPIGTGNKAQTEAFAKLMAGVAGAMVSGDGNDVGAVNAAAATGGNAAANNYLKHTQWAQLADKLQSCKSEAECTQVRKEFADLSAKQDAELRKACEDINSSACRTLLSDVQAGTLAQFKLASTLNVNQENVLPAQYLGGSDFNASANLLVRKAVVSDIKAACAADSSCTAKKEESLLKMANLALDFTPVIGDIKGFVEAETPFDYLLVALGVVPGAGDALAKALKEGKAAYNAGDIAAATAKMEEARNIQIVAGATSTNTIDSASEVAALEKGGLNLFKWQKDTTTSAGGWKEGDFMLHLPDQGSKSANWAQNAGRLREQMRQGKPIYDSYRDAITGQQIPTQGFLRAERNLLESRGWQYNPLTGAYHPPNR
jgi:filamentous hemagglutinin family protein